MWQRDPARASKEPAEWPWSRPAGTSLRSARPRGAVGIRDHPIALRSPWQNAYANQSPSSQCAVAKFVSASRSWSAAVSPRWLPDGHIWRFRKCLDLSFGDEAVDAALDVFRNFVRSVEIRPQIRLEGWMPSRGPCVADAAVYTHCPRDGDPRLSGSRIARCRPPEHRPPVVSRFAGAEAGQMTPSLLSAEMRSALKPHAERTAFVSCPSIGAGFFGCSSWAQLKGPPIMRKSGRSG
jgi:hypothetical protein